MVGDQKITQVIQTDAAIDAKYTQLKVIFDWALQVHDNKKYHCMFKLEFSSPYMKKWFKLTYILNLCVFLPGLS